MDVVKRDRSGSRSNQASAAASRLNANGYTSKESRPKTCSRGTPPYNLRNRRCQSPGSDGATPSPASSSSSSSPNSDTSALATPVSTRMSASNFNCSHSGSLLANLDQGVSKSSHEKPKLESQKRSRHVSYCLKKEKSTVAARVARRRAIAPFKRSDRRKQGKFLLGTQLLAQNGFILG